MDSMVELLQSIDISWALFLPACFALNAAPGPNNMTAFVNGARLPFHLALVAGLGRLPAFAVLIGITAIGLGAALAASANLLIVIKILGAAYLVYIGVKLWRTPGAAPDFGAAEASVWPLARQDFLVAAGNPKAIAIFTAFFPQFLDPSGSIEAQILVMGAAFLLLEVAAMALYAVAGRIFRRALRSARAFGLLNKGVGGFLVFSGASLAASGR